MRISFLRRSLASRPAVALLLSVMCVAPAGAGVDVWTSEGPEGAEISAIAVDPGDTQIVYVGTNGGGVFKSTDGGSTWVAARTGLGAAQVRELDIDPDNTQVLFAVLASTTTNHFPGGLYESTDGGLTWNAVDEGLVKESITALIIDPRNPGTVYAGVADRDEGGVFTRTDGAPTWMRIFGQPGFERNVNSIGLDPADSQTIYVSSQAGLVKTVNGGESWDPAGNGLPFANSVAAFAFDSLDSRIVYAAARPGLFPSGVYKTVNGGESWDPTGAEIGAPVKALVSDATASGTLYALDTEGVFKTVDAGAHWETMNDGLPPRRLRYNAFTLPPSDPQQLYIGMGPAAPAPVYRSMNGATSWQPVGVSGLTNTFLLSLVVDPVATHRRFATVEVDELNNVIPLLKTEMEGTVWARSDVGLPNARLAVGDPVEPNILYAGTQIDGVYKSVDGGAMWKRSNIGISGIPVFCLTIAPGNRQTLYACVRRDDRRSLFKSSDAGAAWAPVVAGLQDTDATELAVASSVAVDPTTPDTAYVATLGQGIFKSTNGGQAWQPADLGLTPTGMNSLAIDPTNPRIIYAGAHVSVTTRGRTPGGVYKSIDAGASWQPANGGDDQPIGTADVRSVVIDATRTQVVYAATDMGVFRSTDGAVSWTLLDAGLFSPDVRALVIDPLDPDSLHVATFGAGVFSIEQTCGEASVPCPRPPTPTATPAQTPTPRPCVGDCDRSTVVTLDEAVRAVRIALGLAAAADCLPLDANGDGQITIDEVVRAVDRALTGC